MKYCYGNPTWVGLISQSVTSGWPEILTPSACDISTRGSSCAQFPVIFCAWRELQVCSVTKS